MRPFIDFHCDTLMMFYKGSDNVSLYQNDRMLDIVRMKKSGQSAQFFATFMPASEHLLARGVTDEEYRANLYAGLMQSISEHPDDIAFARSFADYEANRKAGKISAFLTFEDGRLVEGNMKKLEQFYEMGYRLITLTWNYINCFGYPNSTDPDIMTKGLTDFGKEAVLRMNELGIIVDVSHLSDGGFWDVAAIAKKPFVASHSCARALTPHTRNLTDEMLKKVGETGSLVGVNFCPEFVGETITSRVSSLKRICDHIEYMVQKAGIESVGIGSDFDGIGGELEVGQPTDIPHIFDELSRRGFTDDAIDRIAYKNAERVMKECL